MDLTLAIEEFLTALIAERGLAANTVAAYRRDLAQYSQFVTAEVGSTLEAITTDLVTAYVSLLRDLNAAEATVSRKVAAIRGMHRFLAAEEYDPTIRRPCWRVRRRKVGIPKALGVDEVAALLDAVDTGTPLGLRNSALLEFLYATGARVSEAIDLDQIDVDLDEATALVTGKGSKQRLVPLGGYAVTALRAYYPVRRELIGKARFWSGVRECAW